MKSKSGYCTIKAYDLGNNRYLYRILNTKTTTEHRETVNLSQIRDILNINISDMKSLSREQQSKIVDKLGLVEKVVNDDEKNAPSILMNNNFHQANENYLRGVKFSDIKMNDLFPSISI